MVLADFQALQALRQAVQDVFVDNEAQSGALAKVRSATGGRLDTMSSIVQQIRSHLG